MKDIVKNLDELNNDEAFKSVVLKVLREHLFHKNISNLANVKHTDKCVVLHNAGHDFIVGYIETDNTELQHALIPIEWIEHSN